MCHSRGCNKCCDKVKSLFLHASRPNVISEPGCYKVCNDVVQALNAQTKGVLPTNDFTDLVGQPAPVILIQASDVCLDLNGKIIEANGRATAAQSPFSLQNDTNLAYTTGILVRPEQSNVSIFNGTVRYASSYGIWAIGPINLTVRDVTITNCGNITMKTVFLPQSGAIAATIDPFSVLSMRNVLFENSKIRDCRGQAVGIGGPLQNGVVRHLNISGMRGQSQASNYADAMNPGPLDYTDSQQVANGERLHVFDVRNAQGLGSALNGLTIEDVQIVDSQAGLQVFHYFSTDNGAPENQFNSVILRRINCAKAKLTLANASEYVGDDAVVQEMRGIAVEFAAQSTVVEDCVVSDLDSSVVQVGNGTVATNRCTAFNLFRAKNTVVRRCVAQNIVGSPVIQPVGFGIDNPSFQGTDTVLQNALLEDCVASGIRSSDNGPAHGFFVQNSLKGEVYETITMRRCRVLGLEAGVYNTADDLRPASAGFAILPNTVQSDPDESNANNKLTLALLEDCSVNTAKNAHGFLVGDNASKCTLRNNFAQGCTLAAFKDDNALANKNFYAANQTANNDPAEDYDVPSVVSEALGTLQKYEIGMPAPAPAQSSLINTQTK